jgi:hypothetical protein
MGGRIELELADVAKGKKKRKTMMSEIAPREQKLLPICYLFAASGCSSVPKTLKYLVGAT